MLHFEDKNEDTELSWKWIKKLGLFLKKTFEEEPFSSKTPKTNQKVSSKN